MLVIEALIRKHLCCVRTASFCMKDKKSSPEKSKYPWRYPWMAYLGNVKTRFDIWLFFTETDHFAVIKNLITASLEITITLTIENKNHHSHHSFIYSFVPNRKGSNKQSVGIFLDFL